MIAVADERTEAARVRAELSAWSQRLDVLLVQLDAEVARRAAQQAGPEAASAVEGRGSDDDPR